MSKSPSISLSFVFIYFFKFPGSELPPEISIRKTSSGTTETLIFESSNQLRLFPLVVGNTYWFQCSKDGLTGNLQWRRGQSAVTTETSMPVHVEGASFDTLVIRNFNESRDGGESYSCTVGSVSSNFMITSGEGRARE